MYGITMPASNIKSIIEKTDRTREGVRSWERLLGGASQAYASQTSHLQSDYASAISEAYKASFEQQNLISGLGLSRGSTEQLLGMNRQDLSNLYQETVGRYAQNLSAASGEYSKAISSIDTAMTERAQNFSDLYRSAYDYLSSELYDAQMTEGEDSVNYLAGRDLDWLRAPTGQKDEMGNDIYELRDWESLSTDLFDENMQLTRQGQQFFDAIYNATPQGFLAASGEEARSFDRWLSEANPELRSWMAEVDPFNYSLGGMNISTAKRNLGLESTDQTYHGSEYLKGTELKDLEPIEIKPINLLLDNSSLITKWRKDSKKEINSIKSQLTKLDTTLEKVLGSDLSTQFRRDNEELYKRYDNLIKDLKGSLSSSGPTAWTGSGREQERLEKETEINNIIKELNELSNRIYTNMNEFLSTHKWTGKSSGL